MKNNNKKKNLRFPKFYKTMLTSISVSFLDSSDDHVANQSKLFAFQAQLTIGPISRKTAESEYYSLPSLDQINYKPAVV